MFTKKLSRRKFLQATGISTAGVVVTACGAQPTAEPAASEADAPADAPEKAAPAAEPVTITFAGWGGTEEDEGVQAAIKVFEEEQSKVKVNWLHIPDNYNEKLLAMYAAGTPPDTAFIGSGIFRSYTKDGLLLDITDNLKADPVVGAKGYFIEPQETERCTYKGSWYGIGSCWVAPHIYYNADIFEQEGITPPSNDPDEAWSWDEFLEVARQLTKDANGNHPGDSGFDPDNMERWAIHWPTYALPLNAAIASNGGYWLNPDTGLLALDKPEATEALQNIADLVLKHQVMPRGTAMEQLGMSNTQMLENGKLAMAVDGSWALAWIHKINAPLGTAVLPKTKRPATDMQAHLHCAFSGSEYPEESWEWLKFLATEFYQLQFLKMGLWLPSQTALMTPDGMEKWYTERVSPTEGVHPKGYDKIVTEYVPKHGHVLYMPPGWSEADALVSPAMDAIWVGDQTAEEAMAAAVPDANAILEEEMSKD